MIVAVHQPQYLPWLGYFDKIASADVFVLLDTVQYKKNEWQNRNRIKGPSGWQWLTVPVTYRFGQMIDDVIINNREHWQRRQSQAILSNYGKAPFRDDLMHMMDGIFSRPWEHLSHLNIFTVKMLSKILGISTPVYVASELPPFPDRPDERLIAIAGYFGAETYLAGSGGRDYMNLEKFERAGIEVRFQDYRHPVYRQLFAGFEPFLSVVDLILNHGSESLKILRGEK
jgi:hypothetical protein